MQLQHTLILVHLSSAPSSLYLRQYNWLDPSGNEKNIYEKNLQLSELQLYINNIKRWLDILNLLYARKQYNQVTTLIKWRNPF